MFSNIVIFIFNFNFISSSLAGLSDENGILSESIIYIKFALILILKLVHTFNPFKNLKSHHLMVVNVTLRFR